MSAPNFGPARPTDFLANERTFLAYVRTSLSVMAFGFVISRFGLFLRLFPASAGFIRTTSPLNSEHLGLAFAIFGCLLAIFGLWRYLSTTQDLLGERFQTARTGNVVVGLATSILGVAVVLSLLQLL
jgi:putative membrane protein